MVFKQMLELYDILDDINADGRRVEEYLRSIQKDADVEAYPIYGDKGKTDVVKVCVHGSNGKRSGGDAAGWAALVRVPNGSVSCLTVTAH